jgi:hypothetical protein
VIIAYSSGGYNEKKHTSSRSSACCNAGYGFGDPHSLRGGGGGSGASSDAYVYVPEYISLPDEIANVSQVCITGDSLYISTYTYSYGDGPIMYEERGKAYAAASSVSAEVVTEEETGRRLILD